MDPFTAIGLASNILSFIDFGTKLVTAAYDVYESKDGATAEVVNAKITNADLLELIDLLKVPAQEPGVVPHPHEQSLETLRIRCSTVAEELNRKFQDVSLGNIGTHTAWKSFKIAVKSMWNRKDIAEFQTQLAIFKEEMQLHIIVDIRISAENLEGTQKLRFDSLNQNLKITTRSIETRLTSLRTLLENQGSENSKLHQETTEVVERSTAVVLETVSREGDATRAVIVDQIQQLTFIQPDVLKPILVDSTIVCDPKYFVSRTTYTDALVEGFKSHRNMLLVGLGGVGKSQIAINYANRLRREDPNMSYVWVYGSTQSTFVDSYRKILGQIPKEFLDHQVKMIRRSSDAMSSGYTDEEVLRLVCEWFSSPKSGHWFMVLDNADNLDLFKTAKVGDIWLKATLPHSDLGSLLITSRTQQISSVLIDGGQESTIQVRPMTPKEAVTMFRTLLKCDESTNDQILELATKLDFLPLAIRQATSYIAKSGGRTTISAYSKLFDNTQYESRLLKADFADSTRPGEDITNSVVITWQISFRKIEKERPVATKMLALIGMLSREAIPVFLLNAIQPDELEFDLDLGILIQYSLVDQDVTKTKKFISLHRLVHLTINLWLVDTQMEIEWQEKALAIITHEFSKALSADSAQHRDMAICEALRIHVEKFFFHKFRSRNSAYNYLNLTKSLAYFSELKAAAAARERRAQATLLLVALCRRPNNLIKSLSMWIIHTKRILSLDEIVQAVGAPRDIQESSAANKELYIVNASGPLINFEHGLVYLKDSFCQDDFYLPNDEFHLEPSTSHLSISTQCLDCLLSCTSSTISETIFTESPLLRYAAKYWHQHLKHCSKGDLTDRIMEQCNQLFDPETPQAFLNWLRIHDPEHPERGKQLDATMEDFSPQSKYILLCGVEPLIGGMLAGE